jgi:hypothetical protein
MSAATTVTLIGTGIFAARDVEAISDRTRKRERVRGGEEGGREGEKERERERVSIYISAKRILIFSSAIIVRIRTLAHSRNLISR